MGDTRRAGRLNSVLGDADLVEVLGQERRRLREDGDGERSGDDADDAEREDAADEADEVERPRQPRRLSREAGADEHVGEPRDEDARDDEDESGGGDVPEYEVVRGDDDDEHGGADDGDELEDGGDDGEGDGMSYPSSQKTGSATRKVPTAVAACIT